MLGERQNIWFHATTKARAVKILKEGLDPQKAKGAARVWVAADPTIALSHAKITGKRRPVILSVRFPRERLVYLPSGRIQNTGIFYTRWHIPPSLITLMSV